MGCSAAPSKAPSRRSDGSCRRRCHLATFRHDSFTRFRHDTVMTDHFTYADPTYPLPKRALIRAIESVTGQPRLKRLYLENRRNPIAGESFFAAAVRQLRLDVQFDQPTLRNIPATGPCVIVANHPYGVLDGLVIGWLVEQVRKDFVILTNAVLL